jgi:hypothetical protein
VQQFTDWLAVARHRLPLWEMWPKIQAKLRGHYAYYGVPGNSRGIQRYLATIKRVIFRGLNRCSQRRRWTWDGFTRYEARFPLPAPRLVHQW